MREWFFIDMEMSVDSRVESTAKLDRTLWLKRMSPTRAFVVKDGVSCLGKEKGLGLIPRHCGRRKYGQQISADSPRARALKTHGKDAMKILAKSGT
jgi:hypothetical protein